jgi:hypothetical protein
VKKTIAMILVIVTLCLSACGNDMVINGKRHSTYGLLNADQEKDPNVKYRVIVGNVVWGIIGFETIIIPIYFFGFSLYEPVGPK